MYDCYWLWKNELVRDCIRIVHDFKFTADKSKIPFTKRRAGTKLINL